MFARRFLYVSLGILALSLAYHLGAERAGAQSASTNVLVAATDQYASSAVLAFAQNGDVYYSTNGVTWFLGGNVFGGATATEATSWGAVKGSFAR